MKTWIPVLLFLCAHFTQVAAQKESAVRFGLLIEYNKSRAARQGAELALKQANKNGGYKGLPFQMFIKGMEGPWGTGSKQAVDLIFQNEVWALLGSHYGRNAHLVEQASAKSITPFVSVWSSDPSLSQAFIPWFFNCVPNDEQQAVALIREIYSTRKFQSVATITDNAYDSNQSLKGFLKQVSKNGKKEPLQLQFDKFFTDPQRMTARLSEAGIQCMILFCTPQSSIRFVNYLQKLKNHQPVYSNLFVLNEDFLNGTDLKNLKNTLHWPYAFAKTTANTITGNFVRDYYAAYGEMPGMVAAFAFDGMNVLIQAVRNAGSSDREAVQKALSGIRHTGATGTIQFDEFGNRTGNLLILMP